ncbi:Diadenosine tetraphosphate (Ap4A) hydrolase and other HIT family hydrolases [Caballeronia glathei]|uniref:Histidine triad (HIT) protein n=1 Tax=Caballeronia glathei TaxID=60547 RepID=A0A069PY70_9BURK|nr:MULTISPECIES: HIT family protein [Burkholderiaceae]KDR44779.1 histidine triad (HIT) protein [Caballeronia glathei]TCK42505.1 diadenosine tetraphosphate (Ap4A) HIT family hydrolase [Paraburkholderia sp. BL8N3]CEJ96265.1 Diadenosine tetraphosphate (Ap4A) hydrolase and other HIT family hydrolases [Caballeronia glathei]
MDCVFCREDGGEVLWSDDVLRVVLADEPDWPGLIRVIWNGHVAEMSDLTDPERSKVMTAVNGVERAMRRVLSPAKVNLASLGNQVPHVHWHVIPRHSNDSRFPLPIWAPRQRTVSEAQLSKRRAQATLLREAVRLELNHAFGQN